jgi:hypothetical protein
LPASHDRVVIGVDTHADVHVAAAVDRFGRTLATTSIPTTATGYAELLAWAYQVGTPQCFGVERTGAWGAGLARFLADHGQQVLDINRPDRAARRGNGKSDTWTHPRSSASSSASWQRPSWSPQSRGFGPAPWPRWRRPLSSPGVSWLTAGRPTGRD